MHRRSRLTRSRFGARIDFRIAIPVIAVVAPLILILAMAYGFRQNVPNRGGLIFKQIEYQYFVNIKPLWSR